MAARTKKAVKPEGVVLGESQEYELVDISEDGFDRIKEHPQNPNVGDVGAIDESVDENGWYGAITVQQGTGYILAGNHRFRVAKSRGATHIPVVWIDVDDEHAIKILLADNRTAELGVMDGERLDELLTGLTTLRGTGYGLAALEEDERAADADEDAKDGEPEETPVPEDKYEASWGVMVLCDSEEDQAAVYEWLQKEQPGRPLQVVAT